MSLATSFANRKPAVVLAAAAVSLCLSTAVNVDAAVDPGAACAASKQKAAAKKLSDKVKCHGVAIKKNLTVDGACLSKAESKFEGSFSKAEDKGGCATTGDVDDIELLVDNALAQLLAALPPAVPVAEICDNDIDDDADGFTDCDDNDCTGDPACAVEANCNDEGDDDGDGFADCGDSDCSGDPLCAGEEICTNGVDDDLDTSVDCADTDCGPQPGCSVVESNCSDGLDNDEDGFTDCSDFDCTADPLCP
jgi:hypothetical protein